MRLMTRLPSWLLAVCVVYFVSGCSSLQPLPQGERSFYDKIQIHGRFSANYEHNNQLQSTQGRFQWNQHGQSIDIDLLSPLGQTVARLTIAPGAATIQQSGRETLVANSSAELTEQTLGWVLPVEGMRDWLQGFNRRENKSLEAASPTGIGEFDADGWHIQYVSWQQNDQSVYPKRIDLARNSLHLKQLKLRIIIDHWEPR